MALFGRSEKKDQPQSNPEASAARPVMGREAYCRICNERRAFSRCWLRVEPIRKCPCCGFTFPDYTALYRQTLPACPQCGEYLEQPTFEYGLCDACGSKYELVPGTKPSLLPNKTQRESMNKYGRAWRR